MKKVLNMHWIAMTLLCALLAAGCAKKPAPAPASEPAPAETVMTEEKVSGVADTGMSESAISEAPMTEPATMQAAAITDALQRIHFDFDQYTLSAEARDKLVANAAVIQANDGVQIKIEGHCDERGSDEYNLALGERRAQAAKDYLVTLGVDPARLETISYGEEMPLVMADTEEAYAKNRRAEFKAIK